LLDFSDLHFLYRTVVVVDDSLESDEGADQPFFSSRLVSLMKTRLVV